MKKALYRQYRPKTFDEVLDQEHITTVLKNQIISEQIGHAYLFSGTRGTGKTSCAKIFSRAVNCLHPVNGNPCNTCENCRAILEETTMDVVEMDAASNRRIDDIRELREKVIYPPTGLKYKVYIIDEAHMITNEAFNALLKIMEEPPAHLIFILATTALDKIPSTILSRVQRYEFKRIDRAVVEKNLRRIAADAGRTVDEEALKALSTAAGGAMRDALSLFDQVLATEQPHITHAIVESVLGTVSLSVIATLVDAILGDSMSEALGLTEQILAQGKDARNLLHELLSYFRYLLLCKAINDGGASLPIDEEQQSRIQRQTSRTDMQRLLDSVDLLIEVDLLMQRSDYAEILLEATVARLIDYRSEKELASRLDAVEAKLRTIQRWQIPEAVVREEVRRLVGSGAIRPMLRNPVSPTDSVMDSAVLSPAAGKETDSESASVSEERATEICCPDDRKPEQEAASGVQETVAGQSEKTSGMAPDFEKPEMEEGRSDMPTENRSLKVDRVQEPQAWFEANREELFTRFEAASGLRKTFFERYEHCRIQNNQMELIFAETGQIFVAMIEPHTEKLQRVLSELAGEPMQFYVRTQAQHAKTPEPDPVLEKLKEAFPEALLEVDYSEELPPVREK